MLTIIHGSDTAGSRKLFLEEKTRQTDSVLLREDEVNLTFLSQLLEGGGLFEKIQSLFIEQFLSERKKSAEKESIIKHIADQAKKHNITLWEGKELAPSTLTPFKGAVIKNIRLPSSLFTFLDSIKPNNGKEMMQLFHQSLASTEPEMVFFMIVRQFRILLALSDANGETITEASRLAPWQKGKLEKQAKLFGKDALLNLYTKLFELEKGQKTGTLTMSLASAIDFFLINI